MFFSRSTIFRLASGVLLRRNPIYVQYYITSRCNLSCKQCNIVYANADVREATIEEIEQVAENLRKIGTAIVLLTGGEPFVRLDLPDIIRAFEKRRIHVRAQTNGLATKETLQAVVDAGSRDISISLDSLSPDKQAFLNGSYESSWQRALETVSLVTQTYPVRHSFAALGTVLSPHNMLEIPNIIRFATRIGWFVSLVPAHITNPSEVLNFRSYDREMVFPPSMYPVVDRVLDECVEMKKQGYALYDSAEYIENIRRFIRGEGIVWRRRQNGLCDSPNLYFAIRPNGDLAVCCDHNLRQSYPVWHPDFPKWYGEKKIASACESFARDCPGCMYGSFPEMSITSHYPLALLDHSKVFARTPLRKPWPLTTEQLVDIVQQINAAHPVDHSVGARLLESVERQCDASYPAQWTKPSESAYAQFVPRSKGR